jgi:hypothetical protein
MKNIIEAGDRQWAISDRKISYLGFNNSQAQS